MNYVSIGDLAMTYRMRQHNVQLKTHLDRLSAELTTGETADLAQTVRGDFAALAGIEHGLATLDAYKTATAEATLFASSMQAALGTVLDLANEAGPALLSAASAGHGTLVDTTAADARHKFAAAISALNTRVGDRALFSGTATDRAAVAEADSILRAIAATSATETTAEGVATAVDAWFAAPAGGYGDLAYLGGDTSLAPLRIGEGETATLGVTANDPAIRDLLKGLALAALIDRGTLAGNPAERAALSRIAGETLISAQHDMALVQSEVGSAEAHIDAIATRNTAETAALTLARSGIVAVDPYETATALQTVETQLETLYTLTARLSRLSLVEYL